jgi:hypothetical protein
MLTIKYFLYYKTKKASFYMASFLFRRIAAKRLVRLQDVLCPVLPRRFEADEKVAAIISEAVLLTAVCAQRNSGVKNL